MTTYQCPLCATALQPSDRYPRHVCPDCAQRAQSPDGRRLEFFNLGLSGGYGARYADTGQPYDSHDCFIDGRLCHAGEARFGGIVIERPVVLLEAPGTMHGLADGIVGLPTIQQLNLMSDIRSGALWAQRNHQGPPVDRYRLAGIWVDPDGRDLVVREVGTGSPAGEAGIARGDRIVGVSLAQFEALKSDHDRLSDEVVQLRALVERMAAELGISPDGSSASA